MKNRNNDGAHLLLMAIVVLTCVVLLSGCSNMYAGMGPFIGTEPPADNSDIPWAIEVGVWVNDRCKVYAFHLSSIKGGPPLNYGPDDINLDAGGVMCYVGNAR